VLVMAMWAASERYVQTDSARRIRPRRGCAVAGAIWPRTTTPARMGAAPDQALHRPRGHFGIQLSQGVDPQ